MTESNDDFLKRMIEPWAWMKDRPDWRKHWEDRARLFALAERRAKIPDADWPGPGIEPHEYVPGTSQFQGDCAICGHTRE